MEYELLKGIEMDILSTLSFYIFGITAIICAVAIIFEKNLKRLNIFYIVLSLATVLLIFTLNSPLLAVLTGLILTGGGSFILNCLIKLTSCGNKTKEAPKETLLLNFKTAFSPVFGVIFTFSVIPFILYDFKNYKPKSPLHTFDFIPLIFKENLWALILALLLIFTVFIGIRSLIGFKNLCGKIKNGEEKQC